MRRRNPKYPFSFRLRRTHGSARPSHSRTRRRSATPYCIVAQTTIARAHAQGGLGLGPAPRTQKLKRPWRGRCLRKTLVPMQPSVEPRRSHGSTLPCQLLPCALSGCCTLHSRSRPCVTSPDRLDRKSLQANQPPSIQSEHSIGGWLPRLRLRRDRQPHSCALATFGFGAGSLAWALRGTGGALALAERTCCVWMCHNALVVRRCADQYCAEEREMHTGGGLRHGAE